MHIPVGRMYTLILLLLITACYAAYNLLIKVSGDHVGEASPILATIGLQLAALTVSLLYLAVLIRQEVTVIVATPALFYGVAAGCFIGTAEVMYFYLFRGVANEPAIAASVAIPVVVGGTIILSVLVASVVFGEVPGVLQWVGIILTVAGLLLLALGVQD